MIRSLYARQQDIDKELSEWVDNKGATVVLDYVGKPLV